MAGPNWALMPSVLIVDIFSYLSLKDRLKSASVCRRWRSCLFHPSLWTRLEITLCSKRREKNKFLADVCGRFVREFSVSFESHSANKTLECFNILNILTNNKNLQVLRIQPSSCHVEWPEYVGCSRFAKGIEDIIRNSRRLRHFSVGCAEELLEHSSYFLHLLSQHHADSLESLHLASVKEDSDNYGIIDFDTRQFRRFTSLRHLSIDYDFLDNQLLENFADKHRAKLQSLCIHVHGIDQEHERLSNATWRHVVTHSSDLEVTINLVHSYVGVSSLVDILQPNLPLAHFRQFFCSNLNLAAISLMATHYGGTLKSVHIVDGFCDSMPNLYDSVTEEDPFVMLAWKCPLLSDFTLIGYMLEEEDVIAIARLRGKQLQRLYIPSCCISPTDDGDQDVLLGDVSLDLTHSVSSSLGRAWAPLKDDHIPAAVFSEEADAEQAYMDILLQDQLLK